METLEQLIENCKAISHEIDLISHRLNKQIIALQSLQQPTITEENGFLNIKDSLDNIKINK